MALGFVTAEQIQKLGGNEFKLISGNLQTKATSVYPPEQAEKGCLVFASKPDQVEKALKSQAHIVIADCELKPESLQLSPEQVLFRASKIPWAMSWILPFFDDKTSRFVWGPDIHPTAFIDPSARLGQKVKVGPHAFIGAEVVVGAGSMIGANAVIEEKSVIGEQCWIHPLAFVGARTVMGHRCEIQPHATLAPDGFGFASAGSGPPRKIPQLGHVVLGDDVEIGANTTIDRATLTVTKIASGTKFDKNCHLAHNCEVGKNGLIAAGFMTAGSTKIGAHFMTGGQSVVSDHITIADNVMLAGRSAVTNDIEKSGAYGGYPLEPLRDSLKTIASLTHVPRLRKQISQIMKKLGLEDKQS
jgi:UDP-3-O-[3-hydroxymyristoyl] glucosamine N-acyltransferase